MAMQDIRNARAYGAMRDALAWIANAPRGCAARDPEEYKRFAGEAITRAREALDTERNAAGARRPARNSL